MIKKYLLSFLCFFIFIFVLLNNPGIFLFLKFKNYLFFSILVLPFLKLFSLKKNSYIISLINFFSNPFIFKQVLLYFIFFCFICIHNQKIHSTFGNEVSIFNGVYTLAGKIPLSDNTGYYNDLISFLDTGKLPTISQYRPLSTLFLGSIYYISGRDIDLYFLIINCLFIASIYFFVVIIYNYYGVFISLLAAFLLTIYSCLFTGTFLTEIPGLIVGIIASTFLLKGIQTRNILVFSCGYALLCLAFQFRSAIEILLIFLVVLCVLFFNKNKLRNILILSVVTIVIFFSNTIVMSSLIHDHKKISNSSLFIYKIYKDSENWTQLYTDFPNVTSLDIENQSTFASEKVKEIFLNHKLVFIKNYFSYIFRHISDVPKSLFPFFEYLPFSFTFLITLVLLITPVLNNRFNLIFYLGVILLLSIVLFLPVFHYLEIRVLAVTMPLQILIYATSFLLLIELITTYFQRGMNSFIEIKNKINSKSLINDFPLPEGAVVPLDNKKKLVFFIATLFILSFSLFFPIFIDKTRTDVNTFDKLSTNIDTKNSFLLNTESALWIKVVDDNNKQNLKNEVPISVFNANNPLSIEISPDTYVFNTHFYKNGNMEYHQTIFIHQKLFKNTFNEHSNYLLKGKEVSVFGGWNVAFLTDSVIRLN
jgi:hypothetical protein